MKRLLSARQRKLKAERRRRGNTGSEVSVIKIKTEFSPSTKFNLDKEDVFMTKKESLGDILKKLVAAGDGSTVS